MRNILKMVAFIGAVCTAQAQGTSEALTAYTLPSAAGFVSGTGGWAFTPTTGISVTSLGCLQYLVGAQGGMQVGLWASSGQLMASASIAATNPAVNFTLYAAINEVFLNAGSTYAVGVYSPSGGVLLNLVTQNVDGSATLSPDVQLLGSATGTPGFTYPGTVGANTTLLLGPNFQYRPTIPEPSALALLALAGVGWLTCRRGRRSG